MIKYILILAFISYAGFMIKLPSVFAGMDKELHFVFYFIMCMFLFILLYKKSSFIYLLSIGILFMFGVFVEATQELSNHFVDKKIHGNFDTEDIIFNFLGICTYMIFWLHYKLINKIKTWKIILNG